MKKKEQEKTSEKIVRHLRTYQEILAVKKHNIILIVDDMDEVEKLSVFEQVLEDQNEVADLLELLEKKS